MNAEVEILNKILTRLDAMASNSATWLTVDQAAAYLGYRPGTLRDMVSNRRIPFYRDSESVDTQGRAKGKITFRRDELDTWRQASRVETAAESLARMSVKGR